MGLNRVILAGGSGFLGRALSQRLLADGSEVVVLSRSAQRDAAAAAGGPAAGPRFVRWDGRTVGEWAAELDGARAVVNFTGKNVNCRYTPQNLREIDESRVESVKAVARAIEACRQRPKVLVQAATTAIYGDAGDRVCDEDAPTGEGIPPATASKWEAAFNAHPTPGVRRVLLRISFALGTGGGALPVLARLTRCFLGGAVGTGRQYISWIHERDLTRLFAWAIENDGAEGVYNATAPDPVTNAQFMRELRRALRRPWSPPTPAPLVRVGCFFMRTEPVLALTGRRCVPARLLREGFRFEYPALPEALLDVLGKSQAPVMEPPVRSSTGTDFNDGGGKE